MATAGRKTTRPAGMARHEEHVARKNETRNNIARGALRGRTFRKKHWVNLEGSTGVRDPSTRWRLHPENERTASWIFCGLQKIRDWAFWRGRPL
jgi:hypothetical protein